MDHAADRLTTKDHHVCARRRLRCVQVVDVAAYPPPRRHAAYLFAWLVHQHVKSGRDLGAAVEHGVSRPDPPAPASPAVAADRTRVRGWWRGSRLAGWFTAWLSLSRLTAEKPPSLARRGL